MPLSGKSTHAQKIHEKLDIPIVETGFFVYKEVEKQGLEATPENVGIVAAKCKSKNDAYFTEKALQFITNEYSDKKVVILSGPKSKSEKELCYKMVGKDNVFTLAFHSSIPTRHRRLTNEDRKSSSKKAGKSKTIEDIAMASDIRRFIARDKKELIYGLGDEIALATFIINTEDQLWPYSSLKKSVKQFGDIITFISEK